MNTQHTKLVFRTKNIRPDVKKMVNNFLVNLTNLSEVEGIVLLGGLGKRRFLDNYSDIDIAVFYGNQNLGRKYLPFEFHLQVGAIIYEFNIHQIFLESEVMNDWDESKKEAYSKGIVFSDKNGKIRRLLNEKVKYSSEVYYKRLIWIMEQYVWRGQIHSVRAFNRGYPQAGHDLLNECLDLLVEAIYILNKRYLPHKKWRISFLTIMSMIPKDFFENLNEALLVKDYSYEELKRRIYYLDKMYFSIQVLIENNYKDFPKDPYKYYYKNFIQIKKETWIDNFLKKYEKVLDSRELEQLKGIMCFNLIFSKSELINYLKGSRSDTIGVGKSKIIEIICN